MPLQARARSAGLAATIALRILCNYRPESCGRCLYKHSLRRAAYLFLLVHQDSVFPRSSSVLVTTHHHILLQPFYHLLIRLRRSFKSSQSSSNRTTLYKDHHNHRSFFSTQKQLTSQWFASPLLWALPFSLLPLRLLLLQLALAQNTSLRSLRSDPS